MRANAALTAVFGFFLLLSVVTIAAADDNHKVRVGVLKFGTVNWTLDVARDQGFAEQQGVVLDVVPLATKSATNVAIQGGAVDVIVNDWIWVSRQRAEGRRYTFVPYSSSVGALMVRPDAGVETLADLKGKRLGVAGGPFDKSWLLLRAYARKTLGEDLALVVEPNFAAPPLLNQLMTQDGLPAVLNYWHYCARLEATGMRRLISVAEILPALGVTGEIPVIGWVFDEDWAGRNRPTVEGFLRAVRRAALLLAESDTLWERLRPQTKAEDDATFIALRDGYRAGIPQRFGDAEKAAAGRVLEIMARQSGAQLMGDNAVLSPGTFWDGYRF
jgi:NitT/TauT family transport system substrate-binding protein